MFNAKINKESLKGSRKNDSGITSHFTTSFQRGIFSWPQKRAMSPTELDEEDDDDEMDNEGTEECESEI